MEEGESQECLGSHLGLDRLVRGSRSVLGLNWRGRAQGRNESDR